MPKISLRAARVNADLTRREIADKMGVSVKTIENWENGRVRMKLASISMFASICGFNSSDLFLPKESPNGEMKTE